MKIALNALYLLSLLLLSPWLLWRICVQGKNRQGWIEKLTGRVPVRPSPACCVWVHAVSVGEVNLLPPLLKEIRQRFPHVEFAISTTTQTGLDLARRRFPDELVFFCPFDFSWAVNQVLRRIRPSMLLLTELELWPNLIGVTASNDTPVALINGRISERSFRGYRRLRFLFARIVQQLHLAIVQTETYRQRMIELGMPDDRVHSVGNIKFDRSADVDKGRHQAGKFRRLARLQNDDFVLVAGSTQEEEDRMVMDVFQRLKPVYPNLKLILVPRHPDRCRRLARIVGEQGLACQLRSQLTSASVANSAPHAILIVDVIGELQGWWGCADVGYVGGSLGGRGGQNMIEPAALGVPICFGPDTTNFRDVVQLLLADEAAVVVENADQLQHFICQVRDHPQSASAMARRAADLVAGQRGAAQRTVQLIASGLDRRWDPRGRQAA